MKKIYFLIVCISIIFISTSALVPERVILASDLNQNYIQFWPHVAHWWRNIVGIQKITFAVIGGIAGSYAADDNTDIVYIPRIGSVASALHAQTIRLLLPTLYPEEVCIISDVDMIPLSSAFFLQSGKEVPNDHLLIYHLYPESLGAEYFERYPMCYIAGTGKTFHEIFSVSHLWEFEAVIKQWAERNWGFATDEKILYATVNAWNAFNSRVTIVHDPTFYEHRLSKIQALNVDPKKLCAGFYFDGHCPRPYATHKHIFDALLAQLAECPTH